MDKTEKIFKILVDTVAVKTVAHIRIMQNAHAIWCAH